MRNDTLSSELWILSAANERPYRSDDKMMAVDVNQSRDPSASLRAGREGAGSFSAGTPKVLFEGQYEVLADLTNYDVSLDGERFLMIKASEEQPAPTQINVVLNWFEELKRRVPSGQ